MMQKSKNEGSYKIEFCMKTLDQDGWLLRLGQPEGGRTTALKDLGAVRSRHPTGLYCQVRGLSVGVCWCHWGYLQGTSQYICFVELDFQLSLRCLLSSLSCDAAFPTCGFLQQRRFPRKHKVLSNNLHFTVLHSYMEVNLRLVFWIGIEQLCLFA